MFSDAHRWEIEQHLKYLTSLGHENFPLIQALEAALTVVAEKEDLIVSRQLVLRDLAVALEEKDAALVRKYHDDLSDQLALALRAKETAEQERDEAVRVIADALEKAPAYDADLATLRRERDNALLMAEGRLLDIRVLKSIRDRVQRWTEDRDDEGCCWECHAAEGHTEVCTRDDVRRLLELKPT